MIAWVSAVALELCSLCWFSVEEPQTLSSFSFWVNAETVNMYYMSMKLVSGSIAISLQQVALTYLKLIQWVFWWKEIDHDHTMAVFSLSQMSFSNSISFFLLLMALNWYVNINLIYWSIMLFLTFFVLQFLESVLFLKFKH